MALDQGSSETKIDFKNLQINASEEVSKGCFANLIQVAFTPEDFRMDFFYVWENGGTLSARVQLTPGHMKRLFKAIEANIKSYEEKYGAIPEKTEKSMR